MRKISFWAKANPLKARFIIAFGQISMALLSVLLGVLTYINHLDLGFSLAVYFAALIFGAYFLYPKKGVKTGVFKHSYNRQKAHDLLLIASAAMLIAVGTNNYAYSLEKEDSAAITSIQLASATFTPESMTSTQENPKKETKYNLRELKKKLKAELKEWKRSENSSMKKGWRITLQVLLTISVLSAILFLGYFAAIMACSLSCNGYTALSVIVLILGWGGAMVLGAFSIFKIFTKIGRK